MEYEKESLAPKLILLGLCIALVVTPSDKKYKGF